MQSLLLDFCQWRPSEALLNALLDMLVDGKFDIKSNPLIKVISLPENWTIHCQSLLVDRTFVNSYFTFSTYSNVFIILSL